MDLLLKLKENQASLAKDSNVLRLSLCIGVCERRPDVARGEVAEGWWSPSARSMWDVGGW